MPRTINIRANIKVRKIKKDFEFNSVVMLTVDIEYPEISLKQSPIIQFLINRAYKNEAEKFYKYAEDTLLKDAISNYKQSIANNYPFNPFDAVMKFTVTLNKSCRLSTYFDKYEYTGGAHGNTIRTSQNYNLQSGRKIQLKDLFGRGENYRKIVLDEILKIAEKNMSESPGIYFEDYKNLIVKYFNPQSFNLTPNAVAIYYQQYEIGPYVSGIVTFSIPYEDLGVKKPTCSME